MAIKELGTKLSCQNCDAKFYDLNKKDPTCPKCEVKYSPPKSRTRRLVQKSDQATEEITPDEKQDDENKIAEENLEDIEVEVESVGETDEDDGTLIQEASEMAMMKLI